MIHVSEEKADQVQYLIEQSIQGNHLLFDHELVREALSREYPLQEEEAYRVEHHIERLMTLGSNEQQQAYLEGLDTHTQKLVILTYFTIVENNLYEHLKIIH